MCADDGTERATSGHVWKVVLGVFCYLERRFQHELDIFAVRWIQRSWLGSRNEIHRWLQEDSTECYNRSIDACQFRFALDGSQRIALKHGLCRMDRNWNGRHLPFRVLRAA